jgi:hypothetical protein
VTAYLTSWNQQTAASSRTCIVWFRRAVWRWITGWIAGSPPFFVPVKVLAEVFWGKFVEGLREVYAKRPLALERVLVPTHVGSAQ